MRLTRYAVPSLVLALLVVFTPGCMTSGGMTGPHQPAEGHGDIDGNVYEAGTTEAISGVLVSCADASHTTDANGSYYLSDVPEGDQTLTATRDGYEPYSATINVTAGAISYHDVHMTRATGNTMYVTEDATVKWDAGDASLATLNFGQEDSLVVNYGTVTGNRRKYRFFVGYEPLPEGVDPSTVESATLNVSTIGVSGGGFKTILVRHVRSAWTESGITWNDQPDASTTVLCTLFVDESTPTVSVDVLPYYRGEITSVYGLRFALPGDEGDWIGALDWWAAFHSSESVTPSLRPFFNISCAE